MEKTALGLKAGNKKIGSLRSSVSYLPFIAIFSLLFLCETHKANAIAVTGGLAQSPIFPKTKITKTKPTKKEPVLLTADEVHYDKETSIVSAKGNVEIIQGASILLADFVEYNQNTNIMKARGNVSVLDASGNVAFGDEMEMQDDLKAGTIDAFKGRLTDNSLLTASDANKKDENVTILHDALYSPCHVCAGATDGSTPLWQLQASKVTIDKQAQEVNYKDAFMEFYGIPMLYTPYFSHSTPGSDNQSGLLTPSLRVSTNIGYEYKQPVYYTISPDKDLTLTPIFTTKTSPILEGEYREMFNNGKMVLSGSITQENNNAIGVANTAGWNYDAVGKFNIDDKTDWGFDIRRASDPTYLSLYGISQDSVLTSRAFVEKHDFIDDGGRSLANVQALAFQGLNVPDNSRTTPTVLPLANFDWQSARRDYGDRFLFNGNLMALSRDVGDSSRRISTTAGWNLPYISSDGQVIEFATNLRTDMYSVNDELLPNGTNYSGETGRIIPDASATWRYPFINRMNNFNVTLEPIVMFSASGKSGSTLQIPNEDSQTPEFNTSNLFSPNRYAGYDRVQTGEQVSYGLRGEAQIYNDKYVDFLLGQNYHTDTTSNFPFSNDPTSNWSDYVGKIGFTYSMFNLAYRARVDKDTMSLNQSEVEANINYAPFSFSTSYLMLKNDPMLQNKEEITVSGGYNLSKVWTWNAATTRDLQLNQPVSASTSLIYKNECISVNNTLSKTYTQVLNVKPDLSLTINVAFKNLN